MSAIEVQIPELGLNVSTLLRHSSNSFSPPTAYIIPFITLTPGS